MEIGKFVLPELGGSPLADTIPYAVVVGILGPV
jgi:hypothetical protein